MPSKPVKGENSIQAHLRPASVPSTYAGPSSPVMGTVAQVLSRARKLQRIKVNGMTVSVFSNYTDEIARARAAFMDYCR
ncbi:hypothetical protein GOODEAATRI_020036 [Goodea atripinnis]|uniref:Uncharacterized protein n=1 Tax=Goodea atripinnis TaxID=208336 RepID=A0ABV0MKD8_9TELE